MEDDDKVNTVGIFEIAFSSKETDLEISHKAMREAIEKMKEGFHGSIFVKNIEAYNL